MFGISVPHGQIDEPGTRVRIIETGSSLSSASTPLLRVEFDDLTGASGLPRKQEQLVEAWSKRHAVMSSSRIDTSPGPRNKSLTIRSDT